MRGQFMNRLENAIKEISKFYFIALKNLKEQSISSKEIDNLSVFYKYYADVEEAFKRLDKEKQQIITNEYFYDAYSNWWINQYSKKEFAALKRIATKEFVRIFYEIH